MSRARPTISATIITLNEAELLPRLLSRLDWVDQVVVVDGGSTDGTVALAQAAGALVHQHPFDNFAAQRNRALCLATSEWVIAIDADELPTPALVEEIQLTIARAESEAYRLPIRSRIFGARFRFSGTQDDTPIRLVRAAAGSWRGEVHERLIVAGNVGQLSAALEHETIPDLATFCRKMRHYTRLEAQARVAQGAAPRWRDLFWNPPRELARRLLWKRGLLDGPPGWAFCALSGWSEWNLAKTHRALWRERQHGSWVRPLKQSTIGPLGI
jgi:glycosyltransferase involved in cell wall biosynthesis